VVRFVGQIKKKRKKERKKERKKGKKEGNQMIFRNLGALIMSPPRRIFFNETSMFAMAFEDVSGGKCGCYSL